MSDPTTKSNSNIANQLQLLKQLQSLYEDVISQRDELVENWTPLIKRQSFLDSSRNLACYLALRRYDLRDLQHQLMPWGLSSLGRSESRVEATLKAVIGTLGRVCNVTPDKLPAYEDEDTFFLGSRTIERETDELFGPTIGKRSTKIMVTLPTEASYDFALMKGLVQAGVEAVRINCAHDDEEIWAAMLVMLRRAEAELGMERHMRVLMDLGGPKVRTVRTKKSESEVLHIGDRLLLTRTFDAQKGSKKLRKKYGKMSLVGCTLHEALEKLTIGDRVFIDDGQIGTRVIELVREGAILEIFQAPSKGRKIRADKGLNFPDTIFTVKPLTEKDLQDLDFVAEHADMIGYSFVQAEEDVALLLHELSQRVQMNLQSKALVLKIETKQAVNNLPLLIVHAAGELPVAVMIARGDLAIELGFQRIAEIQEEILWLCEAAHVPVIWATQVLETLAKVGLPTRAEVTDAAMANRAECVMLNKGPHIVDTVHMLDNVLARMAGHQQKKTPQLRALNSWQDIFASEPSEEFMVKTNDAGVTG